MNKWKILNSKKKRILTGNVDIEIKSNNMTSGHLPREMKNYVYPKTHTWDFPGGPVVKNPPSNAGNTGSIPGQGTKIPHAAGQLSPCATTTELVRLNERARVLQTTEPIHSGARAPQLEREKPHATTREKPAHCNEEPALQ